VQGKKSNKGLALAVVLVMEVVAAAEATMVLVVILDFGCGGSSNCGSSSSRKSINNKQSEKLAWKSHIFSLYLPYRYTIKVLSVSFCIYYFKNI
jgi:hypothetical protein